MKNLRFITLGLVAILLGGACGQPSGDRGDQALALIAASADATTNAGSARMFMHMDMSTPQGDFSIDADGAYDFANRKGQMTMQMDLPAAVGSGAPTDMEMVFEDLVVYMKYPTLTELVPGGKPWIRLDMQKMGEQAGMDFGAMMQVGGSDPTQTLDFLRGVSGDVEVVGEEDVRGVPSTHYKATMDFNKVVENAPAELRDRLAPTIELIITSLGTSTVPIEVWIDDLGRTVRMKQSFDYKEGAQAGSTMSMIYEMYDFGTDVHIRIPAASETSDFEDLMGQMGAGAMPTP